MLAGPACMKSRLSFCNVALRSVALCCVALCCVACVPPAQSSVAVAKSELGSQSRKQLPSAPFSLMPPVGFLTSRDGLGFDNPCLDASVSASRLDPASVPQKHIPRYALPANSSVSTLLTASTFVNQTTTILELVRDAAGHEHWLLLLKEGDATYLWRGTYPADKAELLRKPLKNALLSVRTAADTTEPALQVDVEVMGLEKTMHWSVYTFKPEAVDCADPHSLPPLFSVRRVPGPTEPEHRNDNALHNLGGLGAKNLKFTQPHSPVVIDGLSGLESVATGFDRHTGLPVTLYQVLLFSDGETYFMQARVGQDAQLEWLTRFANGARTFHRR